MPLLTHKAFARSIRESVCESLGAALLEQCREGVPLAEAATAERLRATDVDKLNQLHRQLLSLADWAARKARRPPPPATPHARCAPAEA